MITMVFSRTEVWEANAGTSYRANREIREQEMGHMNQKRAAGGSL